MDPLVMNIKREFFAAIVAKKKRVEYRDIKPHWTRRLKGFKAPFLLRLLNGMTHPIPELTVVVTKGRQTRGQASTNSTSVGCVL